MFNQSIFMKSRTIVFVGFVFYAAATAWAGSSAIQGVVRDAKGQPIKNADVRVESRDGKQKFNTARTDAKGRYITDGLPVGVYRVTLVVNGVVKASIGNTKTKLNQTTELNFDLKPVPAAQATAEQKKGKHMVWVPSGTGSHIGGRWVEVDDSAKPAPGTLNVQRVDAEQLQRAAQSAPVPAGGH